MTTKIAAFVALAEEGWFLRQFVPLLTHEDAICLVLMATESGFASFRHALLYNALPIAPISTQELLDYVAEPGWWSLLAVLPRDGQAKQRKNELLTPSDFDATPLVQCQRIQRHCAHKFSPDVMYAAVRRGVLEEVKWLDGCTEYAAENAALFAAEARHLDVVQWILDQCKHVMYGFQTLLRQEDSALSMICWKFHGSVYCASAEEGLFPSQPSTSTGDQYPLLDVVAKRGDLELLRRVHNDPIGATMCTFRAMCNAAGQGHVAVMQWLHEHRSEHRDKVTEVLTAAAEGDQAAAMEWLHQHYELKDSVAAAYKKTIRSRKFNAMRWLIEHFRSVVSRLEPVRLHEVSSAPLDVIQMCLDVHGLSAGLPFMCAALRCGNSKVARWVAGEDNEQMTLTQVTGEALHCAAVEGGNLELVRWCVEELSAWSDDAIRQAPLKGDISLVKYLCEETLERLRLSNITSDEQDQQLQSIGDEVLVSAVRSGSLQLVRWCIEYLEAWNIAAFKWAKWRKNTSILEYLVTTAHERAGTDDSVVGEMNQVLNRDILVDLFNFRAPKTEIIELILKNCPRSEHDTLARPLFRSSWYPSHRPWRTFRKMLQYQPLHFLRIYKMPQWTVRYGSVDDLLRLEAIKHPELLTKKTLESILEFSRDESVMSWFLARCDWSMIGFRVIDWAAKYNCIQLLELLKNAMMSGQAQRLTFDKDNFQIKFMGTVIWSAIKNDQVAVLDWVNRQGHPDQVKERMWRFSLASSAARHGRLVSVLWLQENSKVSGDKMQELMEISARYGQLQCLQGLIRRFQTS
ncbi:hypothetical protein Poli38472_010111 [Pythium oligandrum]|uniref:Ankyrin repeat-containing domain n=1 Tax=Pythium oligandrum TaxID=41045 RepID=A0A8K1C8K3_PYTOL|nr:hypothetical protein Poli38472_010111 [Pythium oligandrum]|eukprot:TMW58552.1 hypothetical protein Poli38472_010111 [Pythium oligandrum]